MASAVDIDFTALQATLEADSALRDKIRETVREAERTVRGATGILNRVHGASPQQVVTLLDMAQREMPTLSQAFSDLANLIPKDQFWRYNDMFARTLQQAAFVVVLSAWLRTNLGPQGRLMQPLGDDDAVGGLVSKDYISSQVLHLKPPLQMTTEDYLHALVSLINELSRLAVNAVTLGQFGVPVGVCRFCKDLSAGFALLNLKNDSLRKRFDAIKYDVKRLEEVVYDITLRGLYKPSSSTTVASAAPGPGELVEAPQGS